MKIFLLLLTITSSFSLAVSSNNSAYFVIDKKNFLAKKLNANLTGNYKRGKKIFSSRKVNCLSCHEVPIKEEKFHGNFGPPLYGVGAIYTKDEIRLRVINAKIINPESIMPAYFVKIKNPRTPKNYLNKTILSAQEVEDLVEYLYSLK